MKFTTKLETKKRLGKIFYVVRQSAFSKNMSAEDPAENKTWRAVFIAESVVIVTTNAFTLIAFAKIRHLRKRSTYLILNLAMADFLVGALTLPLSVSYFFKNEYENYFTFSRVITTTLVFVFPLASQVNLCLISMERAHATLFPFRHCLIGNWFYYRCIMSSWLITFILASVMVYLDIGDVHPEFLYVHGALIMLFLICVAVSHIMVVTRIQHRLPPPPGGSILKERKLTVTLFIATGVSFATILPFAILFSLPVATQEKFTKFSVNIDFTLAALYYSSSVANPFVYAIRLQEFRKAICKFFYMI